MKNIFRLVAGMTLSATVALPASHQQGPTGSPSTSAPSILRLSDRVVSAIQDLAKGKSTYFSGLSDYGGGSTRLFVISARAQIAFMTAKAAQTKGRYTPPPEERLDTVVIDCGHSDLGEIFECSHVRVRLPNKREIKPLSYSAKPNTYHNALGARWTVREVSAVYPARELRDGFLIDYASFDGTEWTFEVSCKDAEEELLLKVGDSNAEDCGETFGGEKFGNFVLGASANVRSMAIPTPNRSVVDIHAGPPDTITVSIAATKEQLREFYAKALPRYRWQAQSSGECWSRTHPVSSKLQVLCIDFSSTNIAVLRITESQ